jgi:hypothetical protein
MRRRLILGVIIRGRNGVEAEGKEWIEEKR